MRLTSLLLTSAFVIVGCATPSPEENAASGDSAIVVGANGAPAVPDDGSSYLQYRKELLTEGWQPFQSDDADPACDPAAMNATCQPERERCSGTADDLCFFLWQKGSTQIEIVTLGDTNVRLHGGDVTTKTVPGHVVPDTIALKRGPIGFIDLETNDNYMVVAETLNCRSAPGTASDAVAELRYGQQLTATDAASLRNETDANGKPWIKIAQTDDPSQSPCYVAADYSYITPR